MPLVLIVTANANKLAQSTIDQAEVERFIAMAAEWWSPTGKFRPLHKFNPVRLTYIKEKLCARFDRDINAHNALEGLRVLDIGCGNGYYLSLLREKFPEKDYSGLGLTKELINEANEQSTNSNEKIFHGDFLDSEITSEFAIARLFFQHLTRKQVDKALIKLDETIKVGGVFLLLNHMMNFASFIQKLHR